MMTFIESFVKELEQESIGTKKMLALVPADKGGWKPHEKSDGVGDRKFVYGILGQFRSYR